MIGRVSPLKVDITTRYLVLNLETPKIVLGMYADRFFKPEVVFHRHHPLLFRANERTPSGALKPLMRSEYLVGFLDSYLSSCTL